MDTWASREKFNGDPKNVAKRLILPARVCFRKAIDGGASFKPKTCIVIQRFRHPHLPLLSRRSCFVPRWAHVHPSMGVFGHRQRWLQIRLPPREAGPLRGPRRPIYASASTWSVLRGCVSGLKKQMRLVFACSRCHGQQAPVGATLP